MNTRETKLLQTLEEIEDPEFPMSIVDMGLIYGLTFDNGKVDIDLTFTAMGCPGMEMVIDDIKARLLQEDDVEEVDIDVVWSPPWTVAKLSDAGRQVLIEWGIAL